MESEDLSEKNRESVGVTFLQLLCGTHQNGFIKIIAAPPRINSRIDQDAVFTPSLIWLARLYVKATKAGCASYFAPDLKIVLPEEEAPVSLRNGLN